MATPPHGAPIATLSPHVPHEPSPVHASDAHCEANIQVAPASSVPGVRQGGGSPSFTSSQESFEYASAQASRPAAVFAEPGANILSGQNSVALKQSPGSYPRHAACRSQTAVVYATHASAVLVPPDAPPVAPSFAFSPW